jgi:hypothetical protein
MLTSGRDGKEVSIIGQSEETKLKRMNLNLPVDLHNEFKSATAAEGQKMTAVLLRFIKEYVGRHAAAKPKGRSK